MLDIHKVNKAAHSKRSTSISFLFRCTQLGIRKWRSINKVLVCILSSSFQTIVFSMTNLHRSLDCHTKPCSNRRGRSHRPWWNGSWSYRRSRRWKGPKSRQWHGPKIPFLLFFFVSFLFLFETVCVTSDTKPIDPKIGYCCVYLLSELCNLQQLTSNDCIGRVWFRR